MWAKKIIGGIALFIIVVFVFVNCPLTKKQVKAELIEEGYTLNNYAKIHYKVYGNGKQTMIILHDNGGTIETMAHQINYFSKSYRVIAIDARLNGKSQNTLGTVTYKILADDVIHVMDIEKVEKVTVIGFSDGGIVAILLAATYPERVTAIATMGANIQSSGLNNIVTWASKKFKNSSFIGDVEKQQLELMLSFGMKMNDLNKIRCPVLLTSSTFDIVKHSHTKEIAKHIRNSEVKILPMLCHNAWKSQPRKCNELVDKFLQKYRQTAQ